MRKFFFSDNISHATVGSLQRIGYKCGWGSHAQYEEMFGKDNTSYIVVMVESGLVVGLLELCHREPYRFISCHPDYESLDNEVSIFEQYNETMSFFNVEGISPSEVWQVLGLDDDYRLTVWNDFINGRLIPKGLEEQDDEFCCVKPL